MPIGEPKEFVFRWEYERYLSYLHDMGAPEEVIREKTKNIVVIDFEVKK